MGRFVKIVAILVMLGAGASAQQQSSSSPAKASAAAAASVNINTATAAQLATLPGIGARTAQAIVDHRQKAGGFKKIEELMNVKGIGEKSFLKMKPLITVSGDRTEKSGDR
jgi:competence protein ComEA